MLESRLNTPQTEPKLNRHCASGPDPDILADIYRPDTNIAIWQRTRSENVARSVKQFLAQTKHFERTKTVSARNIQSDIASLFGSGDFSALADDVVEVVDMFCYLFELERTGLRMAILNRAMCPRFHVDNVPCRLVTTYHGAATEWLAHHSVDRSKLGRGNNGLTDDESGLYLDSNEINQVNRFDLVLIKGEKWEGNEGAGLVHRSPEVTEANKRLFLSLDFSI